MAAVSDAFKGSGEVLAHAVGIVPAIGVRLATATHTPDLALTDGEAFMMAEAPPLLKTAAAGGTPEAWVPFRSIFDIVASGRRHSMMGASQIDRHGNQNISSIGDWRQPKRQLIGVRGAPGNTVNHRVDYWVAKHSARIFVDRVDVVSGVGNDRAHRHRRALPRPRRRRHQPRGLRLRRCGPAQGRLDPPRRHPRGGSGRPPASRSTPPTRLTREPTPDELKIIAAEDPKGLRHREVPEP